MKLVWDKVGERFYESGVEQAVLYVQQGEAYGPGIAWNGIIGISENPSGAEPTPLYADNIKYLNLMSTEEFGVTVEAYTYPDEWSQCDGSAEIAKGVSVGQQPRKRFGLSYKTDVGNDLTEDHGYKLHLVYGGTASPSEKGYATQSDTPEAITFSWEVTTTPVNIEGFKPSALITIVSTSVDTVKLKALEDILYGSTEEEARLPLPSELITLFGDEAEG